MENPSNDVRLRAAPSPTGRAHIGNVRTYFMSYAYAKKHNGQFVMRVEDTDQKRSVAGGSEALVEAYEAFGVVFDEGPHKGGDYGPYVQTERIDIYRKYAEELIEKGFAYYCFCTSERLNEIRELQKANKQKPMYDRFCRDLSIEEAKSRINNGEKYVIRMKFPTTGYIECDDLVFKKVKFKNENIEDQVLLKSDGLPTYHLAVVVDDYLMKISTAVRGTEWFPSFPKHVKLYEYFGWPIPEFAHVPVILNPDGKGKLSKRHGSMPAIAYLRKGYLPEAVLNYTMLCGWSPDPKDAHQDEIYSMDELIKFFDFRRVHKVGARFDQKKFDYINSKHIRNLSIDKLVERVLNWAENIVMKAFLTDKFDEPQEWESDLKDDISKYLPLWKGDIDYFKRALELEHERIIYFSQIPKALDFFYGDSLSWTDEDWNTKNHNKTELADALQVMVGRLETAFENGKSFSHDKWEISVRGYADEIGWKHGDLFLAIRSAVTGRLQSPPLLECIKLMGWDKSKKFILQSIEWLRMS